MDYERLHLAGEKESEVGKNLKKICTGRGTRIPPGTRTHPVQIY